MPKPGGRARLVTDYCVLNKAIRRPIHPFKGPKELMSMIPAGSECFVKIDLVHGYYQVKLSTESSLLTTFLLPSGLYRYTGAPMGLNASGDVFCFKTDAPLEGLGAWLLKIGITFKGKPKFGTLPSRMTAISVTPCSPE